MRGNKFSTLLKLLLSISALALPSGIAENPGKTEKQQQQQQQVPYDAKNFRMDTWKYQENFDFPNEEYEGPWTQVHTKFYSTHFTTYFNSNYLFLFFKRGSISIQFRITTRRCMSTLCHGRTQTQVPNPATQTLSTHT